MFEYSQIRLRETAVQQGIQQADARLLSEAAIPLGPSSPRKPLILAMSLVLGRLAGVALVLGRELRQTGFRTLDELERQSGMTAIGLLPTVRARSRRALLTHLQEKPTSRLAEAFRNLRTSILRADLDRNVQVIMTTSSLPGEGQTTTILYLTQSFGKMGRSVLVIECDLRRRTFSPEIAFFRKFGLISMLGDDAIKRDGDLPPGIDLLIVDKARINPVDIFSARKFQASVS